MNGVIVLHPKRMPRCSQVEAKCLLSLGAVRIAEVMAADALGTVVRRRSHQCERGRHSVAGDGPQV